MTLLDYKVSTRENLMLKAFLPYIDKDFQPFLATYIKYTELLATIDLFRHNGNVFSDCNDKPGFSDIISVLLPYVSEKERETFEMIGNIKNAMDMFEQYKDLFSAEGDLSGTEESGSTDESDSTDTGNDTMNSPLSSLLSPEQQMMFEQLSSLMNQDNK